MARGPTLHRAGAQRTRTKRCTASRSEGLSLCDISARRVLRVSRAGALLATVATRPERAATSSSVSHAGRSSSTTGVTFAGSGVSARGAWTLHCAARDSTPKAGLPSDFARDHQLKCLDATQLAAPLPDNVVGRVVRLAHVGGTKSPKSAEIFRAVVGMSFASYEIG